MNTPQRPARSWSWSRLIWLALVLIGLYVVVPQLGDFRQALTTLRHAHGWWLVLIVVSALLTYGFAAAIYLALALRPLRFWPTATVQIAGKLVNSVLPAGFGALGINYRYLRQQKLSKTAAATTVTINNLLGFAGNTLLVVGFIVAGRAKAPLHHPHDVHQWQLWLGLMVLAVLLLTSYLLRRKLQVLLVPFIKQLRLYGGHPARLAGGLWWSLLLTTCYAYVLYACCHALGVDVSFATALLVMSAGVAGGSIIPTPGGLGSVEAGMVGTLVLYGVVAGPALAAVLLYRLATFWLPLLLGIPALVYAHQRRYV